ncbi:MAG: lysine--tRNA ligase [Candidatus Gottesmanbacteria bacterium]
MYWADKIAQEFKKRHLPLEWVDDMKTPSGFAHMGSLRGPVTHSLVYRALQDVGLKVKFTFVINDFDPADELPPEFKETLKDYLGFPLRKVPSPNKKYDSLGSLIAQDFITSFRTLGVEAEILSSWDMYHQGKFDNVIKIALDNSGKIQDIYRQVSGSQKKESGWLPFQVVCQKCGKLGTTKVTDWDGKEVTYECLPDLVKWASGCGYKGKVSPFGGSGKLPWKVDWPAHWKVIGVTCEGAGKDHGSAGGSYDIALKLCDKVFKYPSPFKFVYEFFLLGGQKMSSSKGIGFKAHDLIGILPPNVARFLFVRTDYQQAINFNPDGYTIPNLFDEYDRCAKEFFAKGRKSDFGRSYELSQTNPKQPEKFVDIRFRQIAQLIQMPNMAGKIKNNPQLVERAKYAKIWLENFAPESEKFSIKNDLPNEVKKLNQTQKLLLKRITAEIDKKWEAEDFQKEIYNWGKELGLSSGETFQTIYLSLIGKDHGPKAAWLILSLDKEFVKTRFEEVANQK